MLLYAHPFSSYCQKVLAALYEKGTAFEYRSLEDAGVAAELAAVWPLGKFPVLVDDGRVVGEATAIIEYLELEAPGLIPGDRLAAVEVRMLDRVFDNHVMTPVQTIVGDAMRAEGEHDPVGVAAARATLARSYAWLETWLVGREWAAGDLSLADCAAAPSLFYADWVARIPEEMVALRRYRARLLAWPAFARCVEEARPFRSYFPPGAPGRD